jgi:phage gp46-like protein
MRVLEDSAVTNTVAQDKEQGRGARLRTTSSLSGAVMIDLHFSDLRRKAAGRNKVRGCRRWWLSEALGSHPFSATNLSMPQLPHL